MMDVYNVIISGKDGKTLSEDLVKKIERGFSHDGLYFCVEKFDKGKYFLREISLIKKHIKFPKDNEKVLEEYLKQYQDNINFNINKLSEEEANYMKEIKRKNILRSLAEST
jgi:hypothetical protein